MIETFPFEKAADAFACMMQGKARFRVVFALVHPTQSALGWPMKLEHSQQRSREDSNPRAHVT
jgi:hypothetical protein